MDNILDKAIAEYPSYSAGEIFRADLLAALPPDARVAAVRVLDRHAGTVLYLSKRHRRSDRLQAAMLMLAAGLAKHAIRARLKARYGVSDRTAYLDLSRAEKASQRP